MFDKAEVDLLKAIELDSDETDYYYDLGYLYEYGFNEPEKAIAQYLKILDFDPEDRKALNSIAYVYENKLKNFEKAEEYYLKAIEIDSTSWYTNFVLDTYIILKKISKIN